MNRAPRITLALSSIVLAFGGVAHAAAFPRALAAIGAANLALKFADDFKTLWLADSTTLFIVAALLAMIAARPSVVTRPVLLLVALLPAATGILIYVFVGNFYAGHLLLGTATATFVAALQFPDRLESGPSVAT